MSAHKEVIQAIRLKRSLQQMQQLLDEGSELAAQLRTLSGLTERGIDPTSLSVTPAELEKLLELAERIERDTARQDPQALRERGSKQV